MRHLQKKNNEKYKYPEELQDAALYLGVALIIFFVAVILNYKPQESCPRENPSLRQSKGLPIQSLERLTQPIKTYKISEVLKEQQKFLGQRIYLEGYLIDKYHCVDESKNKCDKNIEDFLIISDFNKILSDYLVKTTEDINRIVVRAKTNRMPEGLFNSLKVGEKFVISGEFIDNLVPIGQTVDGESVNGLMLVYDKLALAQ